jgi:hypothetical protein
MVNGVVEWSKQVARQADETDDGKGSQTPKPCPIHKRQKRHAKLYLA